MNAESLWWWRDSQAHERPERREHVQGRLICSANTSADNDCGRTLSATEPLHLGTRTHAHDLWIRDIDIMLRTLLQRILALLSSRIDRNDPVAHGLAKSHYKGADTTATPAYRDPLPGRQTRDALDRLVGSDTPTQHRRNLLILHPFKCVRDPQQVPRRDQRILRKRPVPTALARMRLGRTARLAVVGEVRAVRTRAAKVARPGDADALPGGDGRVHGAYIAAEGFDAADALMAEDGPRRAQVAGCLGAVGAAEGSEVEAD